MTVVFRQDQRRTANAPIEWTISDLPIPYPEAIAAMNARAGLIRAGAASELVWLLQHPALITAGTSARPEHLLQPGLLPVYEAGRGGQFTYHGPGQRIAYLMFDMRRRGNDIRRLVGDLERWITLALAEFNVRGETREKRVGIWVKRPGRSDGGIDKIAAIGLRVSGGVTTHGVSINVEPDLDHYRAIVPCGIDDAGVTSLTALGLPVTMADVDVALRKSFEAVFGAVTPVAAPILVRDEGR